MIVKSSKFKVQKYGRVILYVFILSAVSCLLSTVTYASEKWPGVDETVVERIAQEHGREAREPLINTDQGDLLLFAFLIAGVVGGFGVGYYWRVLTERRAPAADIDPGRVGKTKK